MVFPSVILFPCWSVTWNTDTNQNEITMYEKLLKIIITQILSVLSTNMQVWYESTHQKGVHACVFHVIILDHLKGVCICFGQSQSPLSYLCVRLRRRRRLSSSSWMCVRTWKLVEIKHDKSHCDSNMYHQWLKYWGKNTYHPWTIRHPRKHKLWLWWSQDLTRFAQPLEEFLVC